jgi:hypothetical protein
MRTHSLPRVLGAAAALALFAQTAAAVKDTDFTFDTTRDLYRVCATGLEDPNYVTATLACRAFIEATVQYHDEVTDRKKLKRLICYPKGTTIEQGKAAFLSWAREHSGDDKLMDEVPVVGLVRALAARYPCSG